MTEFSWVRICEGGRGVGEITIRKKKAYGIETVSPWIFVAEGPGFEPGLTGPEPAVLPLDDPPEY